MDALSRQIGDLLISAYDLILKVEQSAFQGTRFNNLTVTEVHTIEAIGRGGRSMGEVADDLGVTLATLNASVGRLCQKGYVERRRTEEDRRLVLLSLTRQGEVVRRIHEQFHDHMLTHSVVEMEPAEREALHKALSKLHQFFQNASHEGKKKVNA